MAKPIPLPIQNAIPPAHVPQAAEPSAVLEAAAERLRNGIAGALATVLERKGSAPSTPGQKLLLCADGTCLGTVGGGAIEREVLAALAGLLGDADPLYAVRTFRLGAELGMCCGGQVEVLLEPLVARVPCLIVGAGHVATALAPALVRLGFSVTVCDDREEYAKEERIPNARVVHGTWDEAARTIDRRGAVLVMTHDHGLDQQAIEWALREGFAFVGGVGSKAKASRTRDRLEAKGFTSADRNRVRMPVGIEIGARLPEEIAISISAELVAWRRGSG